MPDILVGPRSLDLFSPRIPGHLDELLQLFNQFFERETRGERREKRGREKRERGGGEGERWRRGREEG
jgi:hypothetical protein